MKINVLFSYTENVIPPRCRKERLKMFHDGEMTVEVREVTSEASPVAIRQSGFRNSPVKGDLAGMEVEYRWFEGKLWTKYQLWGCSPRPHTSGGKDYEYRMPKPEMDLRCDAETGWSRSYLSKGLYTRDKEMATIQSWADSQIIIDGSVWEPAGEPRYVVNTFGLGCNHGGTGLFADNHYNGNIGHDNYFNLFQAKEALDYATLVATERGDTKSLPFELPYQFDVLIPDAIKVNPAAQHGDGDPFINGLNAISRASGGNAGLVAALAVAAANTALHSN